MQLSKKKNIQLATWATFNHQSIMKPITLNEFDGHFMMITFTFIYYFTHSDDVLTLHTITCKSSGGELTSVQ